MKFLCIISGCPAGARKWHISYFLLCKSIAKNPPGKAREDRPGKPVLLIRVWGRNRGNRKKERIKKIMVYQRKKRRFPEYILMIAQKIQLVKLNIFV